MNQPFEMKQTAPWSRMLRLTAILALTFVSTAHARLSVFEALDTGQCVRTPAQAVPESPECPSSSCM